MFLCLLVESGRAVLLPHAYTVSDEPRSMVNVQPPILDDNLATHGVRCYPKQTVRSVQDGNAESDRFCALRWSVLGSVADYPLESQIMSLKTESMHR